MHSWASLWRKKEYSRTCWTTRGSVITHATSLQLADCKRSETWTRAKLQDTPQRAIAVFTVYSLLVHSGMWIPTDRWHARSHIHAKPNRFRKRNKPCKTIKSNVYLIYRGMGLRNWRLKQYWCCESHWTLCIMDLWQWPSNSSLSRLILDRRFPPLLEDKSWKLLRERYMHLEHTYCDV